MKLVVTIAAIRGHTADDDEWEIILQCSNPLDANGRRQMPINYSFDRDTTALVFN